MFDFRPRLHVQISPELLTVRNLKSGQTVSEIPEVAIGGSPKKVLAAGAQARLAAAQAGAEVVTRSPTRARWSPTSPPAKHCCASLCGAF